MYANREHAKFVHCSGVEDNCGEVSHRRATVAVDELEVFNLVADSPFVCAVFNGVHFADERGLPSHMAHIWGKLLQIKRCARGIFNPELLLHQMKQERGLLGSLLIDDAD